MDAKLGRQLLTFVEDNPKQLDTTIWGDPDRPSGPAADLAGWALMLSKWTLVGDNEFLSPDGKRLIHRPEDIEREACAILSLTLDEYWNHGDTECLFVLPEEPAVNRLRELTEQAEAAANA